MTRTHDDIDRHKALSPQLLNNSPHQQNCNIPAPPNLLRVKKTTCLWQARGSAMTSHILQHWHRARTSKYTDTQTRANHGTHAHDVEMQTI